MKFISYMVLIKLGKNKIEIKGNSNIESAFEQLDIPFSCHTGICGICKIKIKKGEKNINPKTDSELDYPLEENERLACQCNKIKGDIEIEN
jgi:ferredoxin